MLTNWPKGKLNKDKNYPLSLMKVEQLVKYNKMKTRADIVLYNLQGNPSVIVECKSPDIKITEDTFYQIAKYNSQLMVEYLILTNGMHHYCCKMDYQKNKINFLTEIPHFRYL